MEAIQINIEPINHLLNVVYEIINAVDIAAESIKNMQDIVNIGVNSDAFEDLRNEINQTTSAVNNMNTAMQNLANTSSNISAPSTTVSSSGSVGSTFQKKAEQAKEQLKTVGKTAKTVIDSFGEDGIIGKIFGISDSYSNAVSKLSVLNDKGDTQELVNMVYAASQDTNTSFSKMVDMVTLVDNHSGDAFTDKTEMVAFTDLLQKQASIEGLSKLDTTSVMIQLSQSLASGSLSSSALDSISKMAPELVKNIAVGMKTDTAGLEAMAAEGTLSTELVKVAFFSQDEEINNQFSKLPITWAEVWQSIQDSALMAFAPILQKISEITKNNSFQSMIDGVIAAMATLANVVLWIVDLLGRVGQFFTDNWSVISPIIYGIIAALALYIAYQGMLVAALGVVTTAQNAWKLAMATPPLLRTIMLIILLVTAIITLCNWIANVTGAAESGLGVICGAVLSTVAFILNIVIGAFNAIIQVAWSLLLEPFIGIIEWILNAAYGGFDGLFGAIANGFGNIISWLLSFAKIATHIIDAIFGSDLTDSLNSLQENVVSWGKNDDAGTLSRSAPTIDYRIEYGDAFDKGAEFGDGISEKISNFNLSDLFGSTDVPNPEDYTKQFEDIYNSGNSQDLEDYLSQQEEIPDNVQGISDNTDNMADSMDIAEEDLKYLRDIAEQESVNRFTTAEISVDMSGMHNTVNNGMDLDGFVSSLTDAVNEAIDNMAEGVH